METDENNLIIEQNNKSDEEEYERFNLEKDTIEEQQQTIQNSNVSRPKSKSNREFQIKFKIQNQFNAQMSR